jgi:outer membrane protein insertion porin family
MMSTKTMRWASGVLAGCLALAAGAAAAQEVVVEGNRRVDTETVRSYVGASGSPEETRRSLLATGLFSDVRVSRRGATTVVSVRETNSLNRVAFEGNRRLTKETLEPEIQTKSRGPYNPAVVEADIARIKDVYRRAGRAAASVTSRVVELPNGRIDVVFTIDEGSKTGVAEINFVGNNVYSSNRLRDLMTTTGEQSLVVPEDQRRL